MPVDETLEDDKTQLDQDTVDRETINDSPNNKQNTTEDEKRNEDNPISTPDVAEEIEVTGVKVCDDVRYDKYFKMKQFGVPAAAVKLKMSAEGLDPSLLE